jgi:hypothetical protein
MQDTKGEDTPSEALLRVDADLTVKALATANSQIRLLRVERGELSSLKPSMSTYQRRGEVFFRVPASQLNQRKAEEIKKREEEAAALQSKLRHLERELHK